MRQATDGKPQEFIDIVNTLIAGGWTVESSGRREEIIHDADGRFLGHLHQEHNGGCPYIRYQFPKSVDVIITSVAQLVGHFTVAPHIHTDRGAWLYAMFVDRFPSIKWSTHGTARIGDVYLTVNEASGMIFAEYKGLTFSFNGTTALLINLMRNPFDTAVEQFGD